MFRAVEFRFGLLLMVLLACNARADITETKHNLSDRAGGGARAASPEEKKRLSREVCIFCHTPGVADEYATGQSDAARVQPTAKWQPTVEAAFSFDLFDDIGRMGAEGAARSVGSVSVACLSCHDAVQALGVNHASTDHPFAVPYRGLSSYSAEAAPNLHRLVAAKGDRPELMAGFRGNDGEFRPARSGIVNKREVWWAPVGDSPQRTKSDLPLYSRQVTGAAGYEQVPFIECTSCHDPHSTREVFLRTSNEQSKLCMACHIK